MTRAAGLHAWRRLRNLMWPLGVPIVAVLLSVGTLRAQEDHTTIIEAATDAAETWLMLVDEGHYDKSWEAAAPVIQEAMHKDEWGPTIRQAREPYEPVGDRELLQSEFMTTLPDMPDGEYVRLVYSTDTASGKVHETVALMFSDGAWGVMGYFMRPVP